MYSVERLLPVLLTIVLGVALLEGVFKFARHQPYNWRAYFASLGDLLGRRLIEFIPLTITANLFELMWSSRLFTMPLDRWWSWVLLFLGEELCYYWYHRASHKVRWFWATHSVHHSPNELNFAAAYRLGWTGKLTGTPLFFLPLVVLGFPPVLVLGSVGLNLLYQFWLHSSTIPKLGWLECVFNTPSHHRVHHAVNAEYLDANYGGVLIVFDRLFNTFVKERAETQCRYGLVKPLHSYNPVHIAFHEWMALARDLRHARNWRERLAYVVKPPGWRPKVEWP